MWKLYSWYLVFTASVISNRLGNSQTLQIAVASALELVNWFIAWCLSHTDAYTPNAVVFSHSVCTRNLGKMLAAQFKDWPGRRCSSIR